jgi:hypothetical protein
MRCRHAPLSITLRSQDRRLLKAMADDPATPERTRKRAIVVLRLADTGDLNASAQAAGVTRPTAQRALALFLDRGWRGLIEVQAPRGGDFLSRHDQGFWAERLAMVCLDRSPAFRAIPYGTSRSAPFSDLTAFREYAINEFLLQAWSWSAGRRWKRPDLLLVPRSFLRAKAGNDEWDPDLKHLDNERCGPYVRAAMGAVEVETSLWEVGRAEEANVELSFTVKQEDLDALRNWRSENERPLHVVQVFYDRAYVVSFGEIERLLSGDGAGRKALRAEVDRTTKKATYRLPLSAGFLLGRIPEPDVQGCIHKALNGKVTVYGRLCGSQIDLADPGLLDALV